MIFGNKKDIINDLTIEILEDHFKNNECPMVYFMLDINKMTEITVNALYDFMCKRDITIEVVETKDLIILKVIEEDKKIDPVDIDDRLFPLLILMGEITRKRNIDLPSNVVFTFHSKVFEIVEDVKVLNKTLNKYTDDKIVDWIYDETDKNELLVIEINEKRK